MAKSIAYVGFANNMINCSQFAVIPQIAVRMAVEAQVSKGKEAPKNTGRQRAYIVAEHAILNIGVGKLAKCRLDVSDDLTEMKCAEETCPLISPVPCGARFKTRARLHLQTAFLCFTLPLSSPL